MTTQSAMDIVGVEVVERTIKSEGDPENADAVGVFAEAKLKFRTRCGGWYFGPVVRTPGVWDIDDEDYGREEYGPEESALLDEMLKALGL